MRTKAASRSSCFAPYPVVSTCIRLALQLWGYGSPIADWKKLVALISLSLLLHFLVFPLQIDQKQKIWHFLPLPVFVTDGKMTANVGGFRFMSNYFYERSISLAVRPRETMVS